MPWQRCIERCKNAKKEDTISYLKDSPFHRHLLTYLLLNITKQTQKRQPFFQGHQMTSHCSEGETKNDGQRDGLCPDGTSRWSPRSHIVPWPSREVWYVELIYQARETKWTYKEQNKRNTTRLCLCAKIVSKPNFRQTVSTEQAYAKTTYTTAINSKKHKTEPSIQQQQAKRVPISAGLTLYFDQRVVHIPRNLFWFKASFGDDFNQRFYSALFCCGCYIKYILVGLNNWGWYPTLGWKMPRTSSRTFWSPCFGTRPRPKSSPRMWHTWMWLWLDEGPFFNGYWWIMRWVRLTF